MYGAGGKTKLVMITVVGMKNDKSNGRRVTSVKGRWDLSDGFKDITLCIANIKDVK